MKKICDDRRTVAWVDASEADKGQSSESIKLSKNG